MTPVSVPRANAGPKRILKPSTTSSNVRTKPTKATRSSVGHPPVYQSQSQTVTAQAAAVKRPIDVSQGGRSENNCPPPPLPPPPLPPLPPPSLPICVSLLSPSYHSLPPFNFIFKGKKMNFGKVKICYIHPVKV